MMQFRSVQQIMVNLRKAIRFHIQIFKNTSKIHIIKIHRVGLDNNYKINMIL